MQPRVHEEDRRGVGPRVLGVLAGRDMPLGLLGRWAESADFVFAADAGLDRLLEAGAEPDFVVGDFDSSEAYSRFQHKLVHDPSEESTDTDKLLALAASRGFGCITLASVEGDQLDHMLATLHSAARSSIQVRLALRTGIGWVLKPDHAVSVKTHPGRRVSLLPLAEVQGASISGVRWPFERRDLHPSGLGSISNRAVEEHVKAELQSGAAFLFAGYLEEEMPLW